MLHVLGKARKILRAIAHFVLTRVKFRGRTIVIENATAYSVITIWIKFLSQE